MGGKAVESWILADLSYCTKLYENKQTKAPTESKRAKLLYLAFSGLPQKALHTPYSEPPTQCTKPACPCRLFLPESRLGHWEMKPQGPFCLL